MKRKWNEVDLEHYWQIWPQDLDLIGNKRDKMKLGFAVLLKAFQLQGRFPETVSEIPPSVIEYLAIQLKTEPSDLNGYPWSGRSMERHRAEIREWCGFREASLSDQDELKVWLIRKVIPQGYAPECLRDEMMRRCRDLKLEPPTPERCSRLINSAVQAYEVEFSETIASLISTESVKLMNELLQSPEPKNDDNDSDDRTLWQWIKSDPGKAGVENVKEVAARIRRLRSIGLPEFLFKKVAPKLVERYAKQAAVEEPHELRRHGDAFRTTLLAAYLCRRLEELTDDLVDLFLEITHKIGKHAEKKVDNKLTTNLQKVPGKIGVLIRMAEASLDAPDGAVKDVIYPVVSEKLLRTLIQEFHSTGPAYREEIRLTIQSSYRSHYRRMLPELLECLQFRSTNPNEQPILKAISILKKHIDSKSVTYPKDIEIPLDGVVRPIWMPLVVEAENGNKINRTAYEICVLKALRERLRCREIWVIGSKRYRDPEEDLPNDFEKNRDTYYKELGVPIEPKAFVNSIKEELRDALRKLDEGMPKNEKVKILKKKGGWISVSPYEPQADPVNLARAKREIFHRWPATNLIDMLKESNIRSDFTRFFRSPTMQERMSSETLLRRILLVIYGLGTNTGLKSMASDPRDNYKDLVYVRRRFLSGDSMREAIAAVANATLRCRLPEIWGDATSACASDSKQFAAWDQNLLTEWHMRYSGRGVMVYWHVEKTPCAHFRS